MPKDGSVQPLVSVIIPTYQRGQLLADTLDSVCAQTCQDFEVIVVEDGSRSAAETVRRFGVQVQYVWQPNRGASAARNRGARHARGRWLAFLDDDDLWLPAKLERQLLLAERSCEMAMIHTDHYVLCDGELRLGPRLLPRADVPSGLVGRALFLNNFVVMSSSMVRRDALESVGGFDARRSNVEDYDLWLRLSRRHWIGFVDEPLTIYRDHPSSLGSDDTRELLACARVLESLVGSDPSVWGEYGHRTICARLQDAYWQAAYAHFAMGAYPMAWRLFLKAWRWGWRELEPLAYGGACLLGPTGVRIGRAVKRTFQ